MRDWRVRYAERKRAEAEARSNTPEAIAWRKRHNAATEIVNRERLEKYPVITDANADEVIAWQRRRLDELMKP
jgi:hypothetical protein